MAKSQKIDTNVAVAHEYTPRFGEDGHQYIVAPGVAVRLKEPTRGAVRRLGAYYTEEGATDFGALSLIVVEPFEVEDEDDTFLTVVQVAVADFLRPTTLI